MEVRLGGVVIGWPIFEVLDIFFTSYENRFYSLFELELLSRSLINYDVSVASERIQRWNFCVRIASF